jgi:multiple sugar transport system substrate-binding protein
MKKKLAVMLMTAVMAVTGLAGSVSAESKDGEVVEIQFLHGQPEEERVQVIQSIIDDFMAENPDIEVTQMPIPEDGFWTKITTLMSTGELPAIVEGGVDQLRLMNTEEALDLSAVTEAVEAIGKDRFYEGALKMVKAPGVEDYLGVPVSGWVSGVWYRKSMFEEKGLEAPTTWDNIIKAAETLHDPDNKMYGIVFPTEESDFTEQILNHFTGSVGYELFDEEGNPQFDTPEMKEILEFYQQMYQYTLPGSNGVEEVKDAFVGGHAAMGLYSTYIMGSLVDQGLADDIGFATPEKDFVGSFGMTSNMSISSMISEEEREAAIKFLTFMGNAEENIKWCHMSAGGSNPVLKDVAADPAYLENEVLKAFGETAAQIPEAFGELQMLGVKDGEVNPAMGNISGKFIIPRCINSVLVQGTDIDTAMQTCQAELEEEVAAVQ